MNPDAATPGPIIHQRKDRRETAKQATLFTDSPSSEPAAVKPKERKRGAVAVAEPLSQKPAREKPARKASRGAKADPASEPLAPPTAKASRKGPAAAREDAESMALRQRDISVSEFFAKNRHLLGFDNPARALLTAVKEAVDNALDACEEAEVLPEVTVRLIEIAEDRFRIVVEDNGPGIVRAQVPKVFGKLLYGSKFHRHRQSRGQQGIGISAAAMYGQLTTGQPTVVISKAGRTQEAHQFDLMIDTKANKPNIVRERVTFWEKDHGTSVAIELEGQYKKGRRSVDDYMELTALANPHATLHVHAPKADPVTFERVTKELPVPPREIQPHPHGVELGVLARMLQESTANTLGGAMEAAFSRVSSKVAGDICKAAGISPDANPRRMSMADAERVFRAIPTVKILAPPTNCLSPIGESLVKKALLRRVPDAEFVDSCTRTPEVYRGNPFQVEVGLAYGGSLPADGLVELDRFANRVPLQYQQSACAITKAALSVPWKNYQVSQSSGALPSAPMVLFCHLASVWVPFTSESKEAIASYDVIIKELRLAFMEVGRKLGIHLRKHRKRADEMKKRAYIDTYLPHVGLALQEILGLTNPQRDDTVKDLREILEKTRKMF